MPRNRTASDSRQPILQDPECYSINTNESFQENRMLNLPALKRIFPKIMLLFVFIRHFKCQFHDARLKFQHLFINILEICQQRQWENWNSKKNEKYAIFYQTISFCLLSSTHYENENDDIHNYIEKLKKELSYESYVEKPIYDDYSNFDDINIYLEREIASTSRQFPKEWTVVQLSKNFNPHAMSSKHDEIVSFNAGITMTIFKHSAVKEMLMLEVKKPIHLENVFEKTYKLNKKILDSVNLIKSSYASASEKHECQEKYSREKKDLETYVEEIVKQLTFFIGPWSCVLTGCFKSRKSIETENEIRKQVYEFLSKRSFTEQQEKLIHIVARRTDILTHQQIFVAITYILSDKSNLGYNDVDLNDLYDYLTWIKQEFKYDDVSTHPCILIIDELLDQLPFEMINTQQEFTRVCSFSTLKKLWSRYRNSMDNNGYIVAPITKCQALINPDGTLQDMEDRMRNFFNYWLPSWKVLYKNALSKEGFSEFLAQSDVLVYAGHGSGLANANIFNLKSKAIVFLFGCGSTGLVSTGLNSELKGAHVYYHLGTCPTGKLNFLLLIN